MFSKLLNEDFSSYLRLSKEDLGSAQELFAHRNVIIVIGPNGIKYDISTKMSQEGVILKKGWAEFSRAHHLCNTDKLIFTCGCHGCFSVLIFDKNGMLVENRFGPSEVEEDEIVLGHRNDKEARCQSKKEKAVASRSRYPRKRKDEIVSGHKNRKEKEAQCHSKKETVVASSSTLPRKRKGTIKPELISIGSDSSDNDAGMGQASGAKKPCVQRDGIQSKKGKAVDKEVQSQSKKEKAVASSSRFPRKRKEISDASDSSDSETESQHTIVARCRKTFFSQRRLITKVEKKRTLKAAQGFKSSRPYFLKKMKKSSVYKDLFVVVPIKFARANLPNHATQISLRVSGKTEKWEVSCRYRVQKAGKQHVWMISGGWWQFSFANNLEEGDILVFEMMKKNKIQLENHKIEMKVHIFRVVKDIKPLKVI
ncbi:uncharacterized protein LOC144547503 [Carex rostrata]